MIPVSAHDRGWWVRLQVGSGQAVLAWALSSLICFGCLTGTDARAADDLEAAGTVEEIEASANPETAHDSAESEQPQLDESPSDEGENDRPVEESQIRPAIYVPAADQPIYRIGATAVVTEVTTGLPFPARVDTGATTCSIHCAKMVIEDRAPEPAENVGKPIRFLVENHDGDEQWIEAKIVDHVTVRTSEKEDERYAVSLKLRWQDIEKRVRVTLNDREKMKYPLLIGRNFLSGDFLVDVALDGDDAK